MAPPAHHYSTSTLAPPANHYPTSTVAPGPFHYPSSTVGPAVTPHYPPVVPPQHFPILSPVPSPYPSSTVSPAHPSLPLHYHPDHSLLSQVSSTTVSPVRGGQSSVIVSSLPPLRPYYPPHLLQLASTPAPAEYSTTSASLSPTSPAAPIFLSSTPQPKLPPSLLFDPIIQPSNTQEVAVFFGGKEKPKRRIGDVLKDFQQKAYQSLTQSEGFESFSYQSHTTPSQSIKFVSEHSSSTTPTPVVIRSPTPKLLNPYEHISPAEQSWKDADISINFKSQSSDLISPPSNHPRDKKSLNQHSVDYPEFNSPVYSAENFQSAFINRPVRFSQVIKKLDTEFGSECFRNFNIFFNLPFYYFQDESSKPKRQVRWPEN